METTSGNTVRSVAASGRPAHTRTRGAVAAGFVGPPDLWPVPGNAAPAMCPLTSCSHSYYYLLKIINYLVFALLAEYCTCEEVFVFVQ